MPDIEPALFRKYVAYAKRTCFPILSAEAKEALVGYYLKLQGDCGTKQTGTGNRPAA